MICQMEGIDRVATTRVFARSVANPEAGFVGWKPDLSSDVEEVKRDRREMRNQIALVHHAVVITYMGVKIMSEYGVSDSWLSQIYDSDPC